MRAVPDASAGGAQRRGEGNAAFCVECIQALARAIPGQPREDQEGDIGVAGQSVQGHRTRNHRGTETTGQQRASRVHSRAQENRQH